MTLFLSNIAFLVNYIIELTQVYLNQNVVYMLKTFYTKFKKCDIA